MSVSSRRLWWLIVLVYIKYSDRAPTWLRAWATRRVDRIHDRREGERRWRT